jgi:hypothetical protein
MTNKEREVLSGEQWTDEDLQKLEEQNRPPIIFNEMSAVLYVVDESSDIPLPILTTDKNSQVSSCVYE